MGRRVRHRPRCSDAGNRRGARRRASPRPRGRLSFPDVIDAAIAVGDLDAADRLADIFADHPKGAIPQFLRAQVAHARALVASARGNYAGMATGLVAAETALGALGYRVWVARAQLDRAKWLARQGRLGESAQIAERAAAGFAYVGAAPMLGRARQLSETAFR